MRESRFVETALQAFPGLPYASLGLWLAWFYIACNSSAWISATDFVSIRAAQINILTTAATAATLIIIQAIAPKLAHSYSKPVFALAGGAIAALSTLVVIIDGPYVFGMMLPYETSRNIFFVASAFMGVGGAIIATKATGTFGKLLPRNAMANLGHAVLLAVALYFICIGITIVPIRVNAPGVFQAAILVILPFLAGCFAAMEPRSHAGNQQEYSTDRSKLPPVFWRMTIVVGVLSFSTSIVEAYGNSILHLEVTTSLYPFVILVQGIVAIVFICLAVSYTNTRVSFGRIVNGVMVVAVLFIAAASFAGTYNPLLYSMLPFVVRIFDFVYLCMLFFIMYQRRISSMLVFGASYGIYMACRAAGWIAGTFMLPTFGHTTVLCTILSIITLATAFMLFSEKQFDRLFEEPEDNQETLSNLMNRTFNPPAATIASRGRFNIAIDVVVDEFDLSKREKDVLRQIAMGHDSTRIAEELDISWNTVRTHTRNLYSKLGVHSRQEVSDLVDSYKEK